MDLPCLKASFASVFTCVKVVMLETCFVTCQKLGKCLHVDTFSNIIRFPTLELLILFQYCDARHNVVKYLAPTISSMKDGRLSVPSRTLE